ncbi:hypothetical protein, partial [Enterococcus faecalis]|uniref:hypothetical protein n=1 Tax=Enterococcus faecalis TaxID=1351 RepID=UPI003D6C68C0
GGQMVLEIQEASTSTWTTERHGDDPTCNRLLEIKGVGTIYMRISSGLFTQIGGQADIVSQKARPTP